MNLIHNKYSLQSLGHLLGSLAVFLVLAPCSAALASEPVEVMMHEDDVHGAQNIEAGEYTKGIERLLRRLGSGKQAYSIRAPVLIDLCASYTMIEDFETATRYCDEAVELGWYSGIAYNNRGALNIAKGDYDSAVRDFQAAVDGRGAESLARRNLHRAQKRLADMREAQSPTVALAMDTER